MLCRVCHNLVIVAVVIIKFGLAYLLQKDHMNKDEVLGISICGTIHTENDPHWGIEQVPLNLIYL